MKQDDLYSHYSAYVDNESAFEVLNAQSQSVQNRGQTANAEEEEGFLGGMLASIFGSKKKKDQSLAEQVDEPSSSTSWAKFTQSSNKANYAWFTWSNY